MVRLKRRMAASKGSFSLTRTKGIVGILSKLKGRRIENYDR
jgi:hypothetical protein